MDGGLTHTMDINDRRTWEFKWTAPDYYSTNVSFLIYGNAVNGNVRLQEMNGMVGIRD